LGLVCDRCLQCFSSCSLTSTLRDWAVVLAGARFLRNKRTHFQKRWTRWASLSGHSFSEYAGAQPQTAHANHWLQFKNTAPRVMSSRRQAPKPGNLSMFQKHLKRQNLKRRYAQGWSFAKSTSSTAYFKIFKRGFSLILFLKNPTERYCGFAI
jgi:hypothetical protein